MSRRSLLQKRALWNQIMGGINHCGAVGPERHKEYKKRLEQYRAGVKK